LKAKEKKMSGSDSSIILFSGTKGGCGCSFIANTVASYFAMKKSKNILLVDLNTGRKDSRVIFDLLDEDNRDIGDLEGNMEDMDISVLKSLVINLETSLNIILPSLKFEKIRIFENNDMLDFFELLKSVFDIILIDFPYQHFLKSSRCLVENVDRFILVSQADIISISNLGLLIKNLNLDNLAPGFEILINKFNLRYVISPARIINIIKYPVNTFIPYDRDIESLYLTRGPFPVFKYNLRIIQSICAFADNIYEALD
jgi:MinD-like ATPase involved in chromosome partitioning or flagellar assembly